MLLGISALILSNTISMGVRERTNQYGVLRAIGFLPRHVVTFIVTESAVIGAIGGVLGVGVAALPIQSVLREFMQDNMATFFPDFSLPLTTARSTLLLAVLLGAAAAFQRVLPTRMVDALRRVTERHEARTEGSRSCFYFATMYEADRKTTTWRHGRHRAGRVRAWRQ